MKERIVRYGSFKVKDGEEHCLAAVQYTDKTRYNPEANQFEKIGETVHGVYRIRGGLSYARKYGITKCGRYNSLEALKDDDLSTYKNLEFTFYEPVEI
jgi:hypothetical protein